MQLSNGLGWLILLSAVLTITQGKSIRAKWSCRHHFLAGIRKSAVLPIKGLNDLSISNVQCHMSDEHVSTEIHSALEQSHLLEDRRSVNFQIADLSHLRELVRRSHCTQTLTVVWKDVPSEGRGRGLTVVSLLNETLDVAYGGESVSEHLLTGLMAGIRHVIPDDGDEEGHPPTVSASSLMCRHEPQQECLVRGKVELDFDPNAQWTYSFAFRTHLSNQTLLSIRTPQPAVTTVRLENDFFIRVDSAQPVPVGQLSDAQWHTVVVHASNEKDYITVDDSREILITKPQIDDIKIKTLIIEVDGEIQLIDPTDANDDCLVSFGKRRRLHETVMSSPMCEGCDCLLLSDTFDGLSDYRCSTSHDEALYLQRDPDRLSFLHVADAFDIDDTGSAIPRLSTTFNSDSDTGLLFFGYWQNDQQKGRLQVFFHFDTITAVYCSHNGQEVCTSCSISDARGFGRGEWIKAIMWGGGDAMYLAVDSEVCLLRTADANHNVSLSEVYSVPQFVRGNGLFIGGTYYEKKRHGLYVHEIEHNYFENTREKAPSIRGCIKDVFTRGIKSDVTVLFDIQKKQMLVDANDANAFSVRFGCPKCEPACEDKARCRARSALRVTQMQCDCADVLQFNNSNGYCEKKRDDSPIVLSSLFLSHNQIVLPQENTKAVLSKVWLKFAAPKQLSDEVTIAEFNSHRETLFKIKLDADGYVHVQVHAHDTELNAAHRIDLADDRVHLLVLQRRTPMGTRHNAKKYDLFVDGWHGVVSDIGKLVLNNISVSASEGTNEMRSVILHDFGLAYEYDEHMFLTHPSNVIHQVDVHSQLLKYQIRNPDLHNTGKLDPSLWVRPIAELEGPSNEASPHGILTDYVPDAFEPEQLLSARWLLYSIILTVLLCLLILACIVCYWCLIRKRGLRRTDSGSERAIIRDSPDYQPIKMRDDYDARSFDEDGSLGTDDTDLQAYRDIPSHRVKIYRESMVSILVPSIDQPIEAAIVKRSSVPYDIESYPSGPTPSPDNPAPLVNVNDD